MPKRGSIIFNGITPEAHEYETLLFLVKKGLDIELIPPSHIPNKRTPDFRMNEECWEMKSPRGESRSTLEHAFQSARKQSDNILFDLRRTKIPDLKAISQLERLKHISKGIKKLKVITKEHKLIDI